MALHYNDYRIGDDLHMFRPKENFLILTTDYLCLCVLSHFTVTLSKMTSIFERRTTHHCPQGFQHLKWHVWKLSNLTSQIEKISKTQRCRLLNHSQKGHAVLHQTTINSMFIHQISLQRVND